MPNIYPLFPGGVPTDGTGSLNSNAALTYEVSSAAQTAGTPKVSQLVCLFSNSFDSNWEFSLRLPGDYSSGGTLVGAYKMDIATTGNVVWKGGQVTSVPGSTNDNTLAFAAVDTSWANLVPGSAGQTALFSVTLTTTDMAANRKTTIFLGRRGSLTSDTANGYAKLLTLDFEYLT